MNRRGAIRALIATLIASPGALPIAALGQTRIPRIALITGNSKQSFAEPIEALREGLAKLGYQEGRNYSFDPRFGDFSRERTDQLMKEVVESKPDLIITQGAVLIRLAPLTRTTPIVAMFSGDMADVGIIKGLARPGGNVTGIQYFALDLVGKRLEILKEIAPSVKRVAVLAAPGHPVFQLERDTSMAAAKKLGLSVDFYPVSNPKEELDAALAAARAAGAEALLSFPDAVTFQGREKIAAFALQHKLPTVSGWEDYAVAGGLVTYGPNLRAAWVHLAGYIDRVLKGADPATMPVELPTIVELIVNLKTARALGVKIPQSILIRADRVIE